MAIYVDGTGYLVHSGAAVNSFPLSLVVWVAVPSSGAVSAPYIFAQGAAAADAQNSIGILSGITSKLASHRSPGSSRNATKNTAPNLTTTLQLAVAVFTSASSRTIYFGNNAGVTDTTAGTSAIATHNQISVGALAYNSAVSGIFKGSLAEAHLYNVALATTDIDTLLTGAAPEGVAGWVDGWSLLDATSLTSIGGTRTLTITGGVTTSALPHPVTRAADTTAPTLTSPTGTQTGSTTASGTVSTDEANGTLYYLASINATETAATVKAASSQTVTATGTQSVSFTGLTASTTYYAHYCHTDAAANDSTVANSASFTTAAGGSTYAPNINKRSGMGVNFYGAR